MRATVKIGPYRWQPQQRDKCSISDGGNRSGITCNISDGVIGGEDISLQMVDLPLQMVEQIFILTDSWQWCRFLDLTDGCSGVRSQIFKLP